MSDTGVTDIGALYLDEAFRSLRGHKRLADGAMAQLSDEQFFAMPSEESNSVAIIVKHMAGNMRSRFTDFLTTDGEKPDRQRDPEFLVQDTRSDLKRSWEDGWQLVLDTLNSLSPDDLTRTVTIRGEPHSVSTGHQPANRAHRATCRTNRLPRQTLEGRRLANAQRSQGPERAIHREDGGEEETIAPSPHARIACLPDTFIPFRAIHPMPRFLAACESYSCQIPCLLS